MAVPRALAVPYVVQPLVRGTIVIRLPEPGNEATTYFECILTRREAVRLLSDLAVAIDAAEDAHS